MYLIRVIYRLYSNYILIHRDYMVFISGVYRGSVGITRGLYSIIPY